MDEQKDMEEEKNDGWIARWMDGWKDGWKNELLINESINDKSILIM